jgi:N-glycosylase/DNA lyase
LNKCDHLLCVTDYNLAATLDCGQAFRWRETGGVWHGIVKGRWVGLRRTSRGIEARTAVPQTDWHWLTNYLQTKVDFERLLESFPADDRHLQAAVKAHHGMRLLRQDPWECLASFILSSTKQVSQIKQVVALLCERFGETIPGPVKTETYRAFPVPERIASALEEELRACKMGFRAPYLLNAARAVASGNLNLQSLARLELDEARARLMSLHGVGEKIADCVLLFAYGLPDACPVDVWIARALRELYFRRRNVPLPQLRAFAARQWRGCGGYAQQYLFHYLRHHPEALKPGTAL